MYYYGTFINKAQRAITVQITTEGDAKTQLEIGTETAGIYFAPEDAVTIESEVNDTFDVLLTHSATIRLQTDAYRSDLYAPDFRSASVIIYEEDECVFAGYIEPQTYSQPFISLQDDLEINCIDALSALQYSKYAKIGMGGKDYDTVKASAESHDFLTYLLDAFNDCTKQLNTRMACRLFYDNSKTLSAGADSQRTILKQLSLSELLFLGDEEDDVWTQQDVVTQLLRFLDLHVEQRGFDFYIFDWASVKSNEGQQWYYMFLSTGTWEKIGTRNAAVTMKPTTYNLTNANAADAGTQISIGETYNQLELTCKTKDVDSLIVSPLDDDELEPAYPSRQLYMTDYYVLHDKPNSSSSGDRKIYDTLAAIVGGSQSIDNGTADKTYWTDWYIQVMRPKNWIFPQNSRRTTINDGSTPPHQHAFPNTGEALPDYMEQYCNDGTHQEALPNALSENMGAAVISVGCDKHKLADMMNDNAKRGTLTLNPTLFVSINGNAYYPAFAKVADGVVDYCEPRADSLFYAAPVAVYTGSTGGGVLSPADDKTTNYILITGKLRLVALRNQVAGSGANSISNIKDWEDGLYSAANPPYAGFVPQVGTSEDYYVGVRRFYKAEYPTDEPETDYDRDARVDKTKFLTGANSGARTVSEPLGGLLLTSDTDRKGYPLNYSAVGVTVDKTTKVPVLACMLVVGDKVLVEANEGESGQPEDFTWQEFKAREDCESDDEFYEQCFYVGFNPKLGDYFVGQTYDVANNTTIAMNLDEEGMAIPIHASDALSGKVSFQVLGPVNMYYNNITRRHRTWFRKTKWSEDVVEILPYLSHVEISSFEVKVVSDNGNLNLGDEKDIVYLSDTDEAYLNKKDDLEMQVHSDLTTDERRRLGAGSYVRLSIPKDEHTGLGVLSICAKGTDSVEARVAKAEQLYVDAYYEEYHSARLEVEQSILPGDKEIGLTDHFAFPALPKRWFFIVGRSMNLGEGTVDLRLKEIEPRFSPRDTSKDPLVFTVELTKSGYKAITSAEERWYIPAGVYEVSGNWQDIAAYFAFYARQDDGVQISFNTNQFKESTYAYVEHLVRLSQGVTLTSLTTGSNEVTPGVMRLVWTPQ